MLICVLLVSSLPLVATVKRKAVRFSFIFPYHNQYITLPMLINHTVLNTQYGFISYICPCTVGAQCEL